MYDHVLVPHDDGRVWFESRIPDRSPPYLTVWWALKFNNMDITKTPQEEESNWGWNFLKGIMIAAVLFIVITLSYIVYDGHRMNTKTRYVGTVITNGYEPPTSGYKSHQDAIYYIIMKEDSTHRNIRVNVDVPTYYSLKAGMRTAFIISNHAMNSYGNTSDKSKNLYEQ